MRKLIYTFTDGRIVDTYKQATEIAKNEKIPFVADVVKIEKTYKVKNSGQLREKYREYFTK